MGKMSRLSYEYKGIWLLFFTKLQLFFVLWVLRYIFNSVHSLIQKI